MTDSGAAEMDTAILFEKFTVEEVKEIEKKTRADIERKKEDLRVMVGERYRDLIEAADTITEMKFSAENVQKSVSRMQELCTNLRKTPLQMAETKAKPPQIQNGNQLYSIAAQIKLLIDIPEKLWVCVDDNNFLTATHLYILARHINTSLQMEKLHNGTQVAHYFPILNRQWSMITHFHATILKLCREKIADCTVSDQLVAECLCSLMLLEDSTPRQVFNELLLIRSNAISSLVCPDQTGSSIKSQVCNLATMIVTTIHQVYTVFYTNDSNDKGLEADLLVKTYQNTTNVQNTAAMLSDFGGSIALRHLPVSVTEFVPRVCNDFSQISSESLSENTLQWLQTCVKSINSGLSKLLGFVTTVKALSTMKNAVWNILNQDERMATWDKVCSEILGHTVPVWEECLQTLFLARVKSLVKSQLDKAVQTSKQQLMQVVEELDNADNSAMMSEHDVSSYVWTEGSHDIIANSAWVSVNSREVLTNTGPLIMKAKAYTPTIQSLCTSFDKKLSLLLVDLHYYTDPTKQSTDADTGRDGHNGPFDQYSDRLALDNYLQTSTEHAISGLLTNLREQLQANQKQLAELKDLNKCKLILDKSLMLGRFTSAMLDLSLNLQRCMVPVHKQDSSHTKLGKRTSLQTSQHTLADSKHLAELKSSLNSYTNDVYRFWTEITAECLVNDFKDRLVEGANESIARATMSWDVIEIQEETEDGSTVKSTIKIPMQVSWYVQSLLYQTCTELNRIGGHALNRGILSELTHDLTCKLLAIYNEHVASVSNHSTATDVFPFCQSRAIQLLFDVKFVHLILPLAEKMDKRSQAHYNECVDILESKIDPFDLDVFSPYIQSNLNKHVQRCQVMYGSLGTLDRHGTFSSSKPAMGGHQEQHNVLPLSMSQNRFPLLPITTQTRTHPPHMPKLQSPIHKYAAGPLSPTTVTTASTEEAPAGSFFESMSTIWFTKAK